VVQHLEQWPVSRPPRPRPVPRAALAGRPIERQRWFRPDSSLYLIDRSGLRAISATRPGPAQRVIVPATALPPANFYRAVADPFGRIWATTYLSGVVAIWPQSGAVERITESDGLTSDRASPILADRDGNVWIGTERGLDRFSPTPLRSLAQVGAPAPTGLVATALGARAYLGNGRAVFALDPGQAPRRLGLLDDFVMGLCAGANGDVWALEHNRAVALAGPHRGQARPCPGRWWKCSIAPSPPMARCGSAAVASA
jgi:hypothetical protein